MYSYLAGPKASNKAGYIMKSNKLHFILVCLCLFIDTVVLEEINNSFANITFTRYRRHCVDGFTCTLPPQPDNGRWTLLSGESKPGESVLINTVIKYDCNVGYKLSVVSPYVICDTNWDPAKLPICEVLCPPIFPSSIVALKCVDKGGKEISCQEATDGTYLSYTCAEFYETPFGYKRTLTCLDGTWNYPNPVCQPVCGRKVNDDAIPLIYGGKRAEIIEYPWVTAVYQKKGDGYENICGGSIIGLRVVLTAAHCVTNDYGDVLGEIDYLVGVGKIYNQYDDSRDLNAQYLNVNKIVVHQKYRGDSSRYLGDIAILVTERSFILSKWVQPVCINDVNNIHLHVGNLGVISGWGVKEGGRPSDILRTIEIPYKYETTCAQELPRDWADKYNTIDKICAGFFNKSISICKGDSGSGFYFRNPDNNRYYVHGVVSLGISKEGQCDIQQNSLYTKVAFHYEFVDRELTKYTIKDCLLPPYPEHGKWIIENADKKPGDTVLSSTVLTIHCDIGYHISSGSSAIKCDSFFNMPKCQLTCPELQLPARTVYQCKNKEGKTIHCNEATEYTTLTYTCPEGFMAPLGYRNTTQCIDGSWGLYTPKCYRIEAATEVTTKKPVDNSTKVICGYDSWRYNTGVKPEDFNATLCTHLIYDIGLSSDGNLKIRNEAEAANITKRFYERVTDIKSRNKNLKVLLRVEGNGGNEEDEYPIVAASPSKRSAFINNTVRFLQTYNFDGLDIYWHYPAVHHKGNYVVLIQELNTELKRRGWFFTATVYMGPSFIGYNPREMNQYLDWINVQSYDMYLETSKYTGQFSPLFASSKENDWESHNLNFADSISNWLDYGSFKNKVIPTIAFIGRYFTLSDPSENGVHSPATGESGVVSYSKICQEYYNWTRAWDDEQKNPYKLSGNKWLGYDDAESVKLKAAYVKKMGYRGVNVWPVDGDDVLGKCGTKQILLKHVHAELGNTVNLD